MKKPLALLLSLLLLGLAACCPPGEEDDLPAPEKPVIYLYPETETDVCVRLTLDGALTCTYPAYPAEGWRVRAQPDGTLKGTADGTPINFGYYTGDEFFKVDYPAGPGRWEVWARVDKDGYIEGMISVGGGKGFPNLVYGRKVTE